MFTSHKQISPPSLVLKLKISEVSQKWIPKAVELKRIPTHKKCKCKKFCSQTRLVGEIYSSDLIMHRGYFHMPNHIRSKRGNRLIRQLSVWSDGSPVSRFIPRINLNIYCSRKNSKWSQAISKQFRSHFVSNFATFLSVANPLLGTPPK